MCIEYKYGLPFQKHETLTKALLQRKYQIDCLSPPPQKNPQEWVLHEEQGVFRIHYDIASLMVVQDKLY